MELIFISRRKFFRRRSSNSLRHRQARLPRAVVGREGVLHLLHVALAKVQGQARAGHNLALVQRHFPETAVMRTAPEFSLIMESRYWSNLPDGHWDSFFTKSKICLLLFSGRTYLCTILLISRKCDHFIDRSKQCTILLIGRNMTVKICPSKIRPGASDVFCSYWHLFVDALFTKLDKMCLRKTWPEHDF